MNDELFVLVKILSCLVLFNFLSMNPSFFLQLARIPDGVRSVLNKLETCVVQLYIVVRGWVW